MDATIAAEETMIADVFRRLGGRRRGPKYLAVHDAIAEVVEAGALAAGTRLPSEDRLAATLGLSVGTVRQAMQALCEDGLLQRRQGAGTFVADPALEMRDLWHFRFLADDGVSFLPLKARAESVTRTRARGPWSTAMPDAGRFVKVRRRIDVGGEFRLSSDFYFDGERFAALTDLPKRAFDRVVLRNLLVERFGVRSVRAPQHLRCVALDAADARRVGRAVGSAGMILETTGRDPRGRPIYYQRVILPASERRLAIDF